MGGKFRTTLALFAFVLLIAGGVWAQGASTARISGRVVGTDGNGLPGVTVTMESANLQGSRVVTTEAGGYYTSPPLPPGVYTLTFDLSGFQPMAQQVRANVDAMATVNATLEQVDIREEITVSGEAIQTVSETSVGATTITSEMLSELPTARNIAAAVNLAPGVTTGVNGVSISGGQSWDNLYTLNGVVLNENLRGQPFNLFIEDALQEQTVSTSAISAEFGRFSGGVVTAVTKSGGNDFSGSFRTTLNNDDWKGDNELSPERTDNLQETYEATLGGRVLRDRLWFFGAGRSFDDGGVVLTSPEFNLPYTRGREEDRYEAKLTASLTSSHQLQASYIEIDEIQTGVPHGGLTSYLITVDDGSVDPSRELPQNLKVLAYTGILSDNFFLEAHYGEREFRFKGTGGSFNGSIGDSTPVFDGVFGKIYNESIFCGTCNDEARDNEQGRIKGTYFLSTENSGSHDLVFGYETFTDIRASDNHQSPTDWIFYTYAGSHRVGDSLTPIILPATTTFNFWPVLIPTKGTDFETNSIFVNDSWRVSDAWSVNAGVRWDSTDAVNAQGLDVAKDDGFSPRLSLSWTPGGTSDWTYHASAGRYVGAAVNGVYDSSSAAGSPSIFVFGYDGPDINANGPDVDATTAIDMAFDWLLGACPELAQSWDRDNPVAAPPTIDPLLNCPLLLFADVQGASTLLDRSLSPTHADEVKIGVQRSIGAVGSVRADVVRREWGNFFVVQRDLSTAGLAPDTDTGLVINSDVMEREYLAFDLAANFSLLDRRLRLGTALTLSELEGNSAGETTGSGAIATGLLTYPEYRDLAWNAPFGRLATDQPVRARLWASYDLLQRTHHNLSASILQQFDSGTPYGASGVIPTQAFVDNPGYFTPPANSGSTAVTYWFTDRDEFRTDDVTRTDLALNYSLLLGDRFEIFVQPQLLNAFNEDAVDGVNLTVFTASNDPSLQTFDPFSETPTEGVHWRKGSNFGKPTAEANFQDVREFRLSVGLRFNP